MYKEQETCNHYWTIWFVNQASLVEFRQCYNCLKIEERPLEDLQRPQL